MVKKNYKIHKKHENKKGSYIKEESYPIIGLYMKIKAVKNLLDQHRTKLINYLKATGQAVGFVGTFRHYPKIERKPISFVLFA